MAQKIKFDGQDYELENLSEIAIANFQLLKFTDNRLQELINMQALLQRAKNSYISGLKKEMISEKAGFLFDDAE